MPLDDALLTRLRRFEDPGAGFSEEFLQPTLGGATTVAVLSRPLTDGYGLGWVICHSFGIEHVHLGRLDVLVARALAGAGFPTLRYHGQGYGDSAGDMRGVGLGSHLADAADAVALLREQTGVDRVGVIGARLGGTVAALVADRQDLAALGLWEPVVSGDAYARELLRRQAISGMMKNPDEDAGRVAALRRELETAGSIDLGGFPLSRQAFDELAGVDLVRDVQRFRGPSLVVGVSRTGRAGARIVALRDHLEQLSGSSRLETVQDRFASEFGRFHYRTDPPTGGKKDTLFPVSRQIAARAAAWALEVASAASPASPARGTEVPAGERT